MLLQPFDLRLSSSPIPRILLLLVCLFNTFAAALPTGQALVSSSGRFPAHDHLILHILHDQAGTVLCLSFNQLQKTFCQKSSTFIGPGTTKFVNLGQVLFTTPNSLNTVTEYLSHNLVGSTDRGQDTLIAWERMTGVIDALAELPNPIFQDKSEIMKTWEQTLLKERPIELKVESLLLQDGKRSGDLRLRIGHMVITFVAPRLNSESAQAKSYDDESDSTNSHADNNAPTHPLLTRTVRFRDSAAIEDAIWEMQRVSTHPKIFPSWFYAVLEEEKLTKTMSYDGLPWNQIDKAMELLPGLSSGFRYIKDVKVTAESSSAWKRDWGEVRVEGLTTILRERKAMRSKGSKRAKQQEEDKVYARERPRPLAPKAGPSR
ncbi:hypothetical protein F5878DRAFT_656277 [Lentinula raphanica]|uniref:Uncharacterized protein n=1 Tax=Lentinula raphanica TaxID=153919 RepID=A0AA38PJ54_9AGAR|nr:hypothetical protein F5878DRAFT_656277 [Lentinula raphanica]